MSVEIAWKQNILVSDFQLLKSLLVVFGFGSQAFFCGFSRQNICSVVDGRKSADLPATFVDRIFYFLQSFSGDNCCNRIYLSPYRQGERSPVIITQRQLFGDPFPQYFNKKQGWKNGRSQYLSENREYAVWYDRINGGWNVGSVEHQSYVGVWSNIYTRSRAQCPTEPENTWKYLDNLLYKDAKDGFQIFCEGD